VSIGVFVFTSIIGCKYVENRRLPSRPRAQFGVFFGTQLQQRKEVPFSPGNLKQQQGFRIEFERKLTHAVPVEWEIDYPTKRSGPRGPGNAPRATRKGRAELPLGVDQFEQKIELLPTDSLGTWNIRVRVDGAVVLDRPFLVVPDGSSNSID
jgi:hypothetical protein